MIRSLEEPDLANRAGWATTGWTPPWRPCPRPTAPWCATNCSTSLCEAVEPAMTPEEFARAVEKIGVCSSSRTRSPSPTTCRARRPPSPLVGAPWLGIPTTCARPPASASGSRCGT